MDPRISIAIRKIRESLGDRLSLSSIGNHVGLSPWHFSRLFKRETGVPFKRWLQEERLRRAATLLADPRFRVKEIAARAGYSTTSDLTRAFKKRFHVSPTGYRSVAPGGGQRMLTNSFWG